MEIKPHKKSSKKIKGPIQIHKIYLKKYKQLKTVCNATMELNYIYKNQANLKLVSILSQSPNI